MFSIHTTRGCFSIVLADFALSAFFYSLFFWVLPDFPEFIVIDWLQGFIIVSSLSLVVLFSLAITNLYAFIEYIYTTELFKRIALAFLICCGYIVTLSFFLKSLFLITWRLLPPLCLTYVSLFFFRYFIYYALPNNRKRILILGVNDLSREIITRIHERRFRGFEIVGVATTDANQESTNFEGVPVIGLMDSVSSSVVNFKIDIVVVALRDRRGKLPIRELLKVKLANVTIKEGSTFFEELERKVMIDEFLKPSWFVFEGGFSQTPLHRAIKRIQGILVSLMLLTLLSPLLILIALFIKLGSPGPIFYQQERIGYSGKVFKLLKFRSMHQEAEAMSGPTYAREDDARITPIGRIIRKTRLDEAPQFINIFKGNMDLVGPRPERPIFVKMLEEQIPYYNLRHTVRPGLTGWAQVHYHYGDNVETSKEKLQYDLYYVKHSSWFLDLWIIVLTVKEVLFARGR